MEEKHSLRKNIFGLYRKIFCFFISLSISMGMSLFLVRIPAQAEEAPYRTVRVGYYQVKNFQEGDGKNSLRSGYSYEYLQKIAAYTGWKYEYVPGNWAELYQKLMDGEIDLLAGVAYSEKRSSEICYPDYEMLKETFYIYKDIENTSMKSGESATYSGKKIGVVNDPKMVSCVKKWREENQADIELVYYADLEGCAEDFNKHKLDGFVSADNIVSSYSGITPVELIGREPYYLGVAKGSQDLLKELNTALSIINGQDSLYLDTLRNKYSADTSVSVFLSRQEQEWMQNHPAITVGYLNNYMPYSDTDRDGNITGLVADLIPDLFHSLPGNYHPDIKYQRFDSHDQMIQALRDGKVDFVFPVGGEIPYAEMIGYQQSSVVVSASIDLVYADEYGEHTMDRLAVNRDNQLQGFYTKANYPDAEIIYCDTIEECIKLVKQGKADSTIINALRSTKLVGADKNLNILPLEKTDDRCFGVNFGNTALLRILNHGISILGEGYGINHAYQYVGDLMVYTADDFFKSHIQLVYGTVSAFFLLLILFGVNRYRNLHIRAEKEKKQNQILEDALRRAKQASYAKQVFLNNMSHDIRTPLNAILGIIEMNRKCRDEAVIEENRKRATASIYQLLSLVNNVIEMSKLEGEKISGEQEIVNLRKVMEDLAESMTKQASEAGLELIRENENLRAEDWPIVYGNSAHIREVLQHILENAIKYNRPDGKIVWEEMLIQKPVLNLESGPEKQDPKADKVVYKCTVSDTGIGMEQQFLEHIFEPFSQERMDARTVYRGAGLGMPIAKTLIEQMGGTIEVTSERNVGTTVHISIPFTKIPDSQYRQKEEASADNSIKETAVKDINTNININIDNDININIDSAINTDNRININNSINTDNSINTGKKIGRDTENKEKYAVDMQMNPSESLSSGRSEIQSESAISGSDLSGIKILLVEDNELNIEIARFLLEDAGAAVFVAMDGSQAVTSYLDKDAGAFDVVLMDLMMPVMDGYEATRKIRSSGRKDAQTIPIFATTACVSEEAKTECVQAGMNEFLEKPLDMNKVIAMIARFTKRDQIA